MARVEDRIVGHGGERLREAVVERLGVATRQVGAPTTVEEERVARDERVVDEEALASRRVPGGVDQLDRHGAHLHDVAGRVRHQVGGVEVGHLEHPLGLGGLHVNRHGLDRQQFGHALDLHAHHRATAVVRVVVGDERAHESHVVGLRDRHQVGDRVRRVDHDALAGRAIADQVREVDHLTGHRITDGEVAAREQLTEVEPGLDLTRVVGACVAEPVLAVVVGAHAVTVLPSVRADDARSHSPSSRRYAASNRS